MRLAQRRFAEGFGAFRAGADGAEVVVAEDAGGVAVIEEELDGVVPDLRGRLRASLRFIHRQQRRRSKNRACGGRRGLFFGALVVAGGAGAVFAEVGEVEVAQVIVGPGDIDAGAAFDVDFDGGGLFALVEGRGHRFISVMVLGRN